MPAGAIPDRYTCGGTDAGVPRAALGPRGDAERQPGPVGDALRAAIKAKQDGYPNPTSGYRLLEDHPDSKVFAAWHTDPEVRGLMRTVLVARSGDGWTAEARGDCEPQLAVPGFRWGGWTLDPAGRVPPPGSRSIPILVYDFQCHGWDPPTGRVAHPFLTSDAESVSIAFVIKPPTGEITCPFGDPLRAVLELPEPIGDRRLLDGGTYPERPVTMAP